MVSISLSYPKITAAISYGIMDGHGWSSCSRWHWWHLLLVAMFSTGWTLFNLLLWQLKMMNNNLTTIKERVVLTAFDQRFLQPFCPPFDCRLSCEASDHNLGDTLTECLMIWFVEFGNSFCSGISSRISESLFLSFDGCKHQKCDCFPKRQSNQ